MKFGLQTEEGIDKKFLKKIIELFGDEGSNKEQLIVRSYCSQKTSSANNEILVITNLRVGIAKDGFMGGLSNKVIFPIKELSQIGAAYSFHTEQMGMNLKEYTFLTLRLYRNNGEIWERHINIGKNEQEVNAYRPWVVSVVAALTKCGIEVFEDDGVESEDRTTMGFGGGRFFDPDDLW